MALRRPGKPAFPVHLNRIEGSKDGLPFMLYCTEYGGLDGSFPELGTTAGKVDKFALAQQYRSTMQQ